MPTNDIGFIEPDCSEPFTDSSTSIQIWIRVYKISGKISITDKEFADLRLRDMSYNIALIYQNLITQALAWANGILNPVTPTP